MQTKCLLESASARATERKLIDLVHLPIWLMDSGRAGGRAAGQTDGWTGGRTSEIRRRRRPCRCHPFLSSATPIHSNANHFRYRG